MSSEDKKINQNSGQSLPAEPVPGRRTGPLECGMIVGVHGIAGTVKVDPWCDSPEVFASLKRVFVKSGETFTELRIKKNSVQKRNVLSKLEGIDTPEAAEAMRGTVLYAAREDIPRDGDSFFIADLIGLPVIDADTGREYGRIREVFNAGASDIYTVATGEGDRMIPAVPEFIDAVDLSRGVFVRPIEGMFD